MSSAQKATGRGSLMSPAIQGVAWMTASSMFYAFTYVTIRELSETFSVFEITFFRALLGTVAMTPWLMRAGLPALRTRRWGLYIFRAVISYSGMLCWFYGLSTMALADATAIMFTAPLLTVLFLSISTQERANMRRWAAILCGFAGALIVIRPGFTAVTVATFAIMWTAVAYGAGNAITRALTKTEDTNAVVFLMFATMLPLTIVPAANDWVTPGLADLPMILAFGALSLVSMQCMTRSLAVAPASVGMPLFYLQLPFVAVLGFLFYGQVSDIWVWVGAAVICASGYSIVLSEARAKSS